MAHELRKRQDGGFDFAYRKSEGLPWHGLGEGLEDDQPFEVWCKAAGFDHKIQRGIVRYATAEHATSDTLRMVDDKVVLFRSDDKAPLSVVSTSYKVVQPNEVLEFFRDVVETLGFTLSTAGVLFHGRRYFCTAKFPDDFTFAGGDRMSGYLSLWTSCDLSTPTTAKAVATRIVCANTLQMATEEQTKHIVQTKHSTKFDPEKVKKELGIVTKTYREFMQELEMLTQKGYTRGVADAFVADLVRDVTMSKDSTNDVRNGKPFQTIMHLIANGRGQNLKSARGTLWGLLNAVTEYADHHARAASDSQRIYNAQFGKTNTLKNEARKRLLALVA